ncbi:MAG: hypothetical protein LBE64_11925 [Acinetobacter pittii]|jgi:hypothetical protein|nr:hypothetical protein [Acinetobacter pittii]
MIIDNIIVITHSGELSLSDIPKKKKKTERLFVHSVDTAVLSGVENTKNAFTNAMHAGI